MAMLRDAASSKLTSQTRERFHRIDAALDQLDDRSFLCRMYGFHAPAERQLAATCALDDVVADAKLRINKLGDDILAAANDCLDRLETWLADHATAS